MSGVTTEIRKMISAPLPVPWIDEIRILGTVHRGMRDAGNQLEGVVSVILILLIY